MKRILVLSKSNSIRGPIMCGWLNYYCGEDAEIIGAAFEPEAINLLAARVMTDAVIDIIGLKQHLFEDIAEEDFDFVLDIKTDKHEEHPVLDGAKIIITKVLPDLSKISGDENELLMKFNALRDEAEDFSFDFVNDNIRKLIPDDLFSMGKI